MGAENRLALVTGGAGGLGLASAMRLAASGVRVALTDIDGDAAQTVAAQLPGAGHIGFALDISDERSVISAFNRIESDIGAIAIVANFAGVLRGGSGDFSLAGLTVTEWERVFAINSTGSFLVTREMARRRPGSPVTHGRIILVSSAGAQIGGYQGSAAYFSSKGSVLTLVKAAARELASLGITVNGIAPGPIDTPMLRAATEARGGSDSGYTGMSRVPLARIGTPDEVAAATMYLVSRDAGFVTGAVMDVNGGLRMQ
jgi:3-oxoacyl-[acyl-carrier protein] reductase